MSDDIRSIDWERGFLHDLLGVLEAHSSSARNTGITVELALEDDAFITGVAYVACQRYITSSCGWLRVPKHSALLAGPRLNAEVTYAEALNAAADYWKHADAWTDPAEAKRSRNTRRVLTAMGLDPNDPYTGHDLFDALGVRDIRDFVPILESWRSEVWAGVQSAEATTHG
jgi:hypothetical protein